MVKKQHQFLNFVQSFESDLIFMYSSVMNAVIKLLLRENEINCLKGEPSWKGGYKCIGIGIRVFRGQFLPGF